MPTTPSFLPSDNPRVPAAQYPFRHCTDIQTRLTDIDVLGHVNNNVFLSYMDLAKLRYISDVTQGTMTIHDIRSVIVNINCDFYEPAYFDEQLQVWTAITHVGTRSFVIEQRIINAESGHTKCISRTTLAGFDPITATGADLDPVLTADVAAFENRPELHIQN